MTTPHLKQATGREGAQNAGWRPGSVRVCGGGFENNKRQSVEQWQALIKPLLQLIHTVAPLSEEFNSLTLRI